MGRGAPAPPVLFSRRTSLPVPCWLSSHCDGTQIRPATSLGFPRCFRAELPSTALPCLNSCCPVTLSPNVTSFKKQSLTADWIPTHPIPPPPLPPAHYTVSSQLESCMETSSCGTVESYASLPGLSAWGGRSPSLILYSMWCPVLKPASVWWGLMGAMDRSSSLEPGLSYKQPAPCGLPRPNPAVLQGQKHIPSQPRAKRVSSSTSICSSRGSPLSVCRIQGPTRPESPGEPDRAGHACGVGFHEPLGT